MATYLELKQLSEDATLIEKLTTAVAITAYNIGQEPLVEPVSEGRRRWAKEALINPSLTASKIIWLLLAENKNATVAQIQAVTDATLQTAVDNAVDLLLQ